MKYSVGIVLAVVVMTRTASAGVVPQPIKRMLFDGECKVNNNVTTGYPPPGKCSYEPPGDEGTVQEPPCDLEFPCLNFGDACMFNSDDMTGTAICSFTDDELVERRQGFHDRNHQAGLEHNKREAPNQLWWSFRMKIRVVTSRYMGTVNPMGVFQVDLHEAWALFIEAAKVTIADEPAADRLVAQIIMARQLGQLSRLNPVAAVINGGGNFPARLEQAVTSSGQRMWTDLPFFASDLQAYWLANVNSMTRAEREGLAGICGRLSACGVCDSEVTACALILLRQALETPRPLVEASADEATALCEYLPALQTWLLYGSYQIMTCCMQDHVPNMAVSGNTNWHESGQLLPEQILGFTMGRWRFWKERLRSIEREVGDEEARDKSRRCANYMDSWERITGGYGEPDERARTHRAHFLGQT